MRPMPDDARIRELWLQGRTGREIAAELGRRAKSIHRRARALDLPKRPPGPPPATAPRTYEVSICGFGPVRREAHSTSAARAAVYRAFSEVYPCAFRHFIGISRVRLVREL